MGEWPSITLKDTIQPGRGISYGIVQPGAPTVDGVPIARVSDIRNGQVATNSPLRVHRDIESQYSRTRLHGGELLITIVGTIGETVIAPPELAGWNVARAVAVLPIKQEIGAYWVQLALKAPVVLSIIDSRLNTTVQATLNLGDLAQLPVLLPPIAERERIISILRALDDKIELNRRMNETLEAMARAIFKDWFVDFGPVRAKAEGRPAYLAPEIWSLFPAALDDEDKPMGWEFSTLAEVAALNPETWSRANAPEEIAYVDLANTKWGVIESTQRHAWAEAPSRAQRILRPGDTIVGTVRPGNGSYAFVSDDGLTGSTGFAVLRPIHLRYREFIYLTSTSAENIERLTHLADGAAYPAVRPDVVSETGVTLPGTEIMNSLSRLTAPLFERWEANKRENKTLAQTLDLLLPKLMSGEIRLRDAEKAVEAAA